MKYQHYFLLFFFLWAGAACSDDSADDATVPANDALRQGITLQGVGGSDNAMAVGTIGVSFNEAVIQTATSAVLYFNGEEVASSSSAPFELSGFNTRTVEDGTYPLRVVVNYEDGGVREAEYLLQVSNVLLRLHNNLFELHSGHLDHYGERVAIADKEGNVLDWKDVRAGGDFVFYAPDGFFDETIGLFAINGDRAEDIAWLAYTGIPRGMRWSNRLGEEKGLYANDRQQVSKNIQLTCNTNCPQTGTMFFSSSDWGPDYENIYNGNWPVDYYSRINKIDQYLLAGMKQGNSVRYGVVNMADASSTSFDLSTFQAKTAQEQLLSSDASYAEVQLKFAPDQRWPINLSSDSQSNNAPGESVSYLVPAAGDVVSYLVDVSWDVDASNAFGMKATKGITKANTIVTAPEPVSSLSITDTGFRSLQVSLEDQSLATFSVYFWYSTDDFSTHEYLHVAMGGEKFEPIRLEQIFEGTTAASFENVALEGVAVNYLPGMTPQQYLDYQKDSYFPLVADPFFYNLQEIRGYSLYVDYSSEGGRKKSFAQRKFQPLMKVHQE